MKRPEDDTYESLAFVPELKAQRVLPEKHRRVTGERRGMDKVRAINSGKYDRKRADAKLRRFD